MSTKEERYAEAWRRGILPEDKKAAYYEAVRRGLMKNTELKAQLEGVNVPDIPEPPPIHEDSAAEALKESARALVTGAANAADIIPEMGDAVVSAAVWAAHKFGVGDGTYTRATRFKDLLPDAAKPKTEAGRAMAEILPYMLTPESKVAEVPALARKMMGVGERLAKPLTERLATTAAHSTLGSLAQSDSTGESAAGLMVENALFGELFHNGGRLLNAGYKAFTGAPEAAAADILRQAAESGVHPATMKDLPELLESAGMAAKKGAEKAGDELAYAVNPSEKILAAAEELGIHDLLLPSHFSQNPAYQAIEQGLKSIPGSILDAHERRAIGELAKKTDELITEYGGTIDKSELSDRYKSRMMEQIHALEKEANDLFEAVQKNIPGDKLIGTKAIMKHLKDKSDMLGGEEFLSTAERNVMRQMNPESMPTYARLSLVRQQIGDALSKKQGPFKDMATGELKQLYGALADDQQQAANFYKVGNEYKLANELTFQRKALEKDLIGVLGKDLSSAITTKAGQGVKGLMQGNYKAFDQVLSKVPVDMRQELVMTALNDAFTQGSRQEKMLNIPGFVDWYHGLQRNPEAMKRITNNIPKEAADRLKNIYEVANGIRQAKSKEISTGRIQSLIEKFDKDNGALAKLFGAGGKTAVAGAAGGIGGAPAAAVASTAISLLSRPKDKLTVLADKLLASQEFKGLTKRIAAGGAETEAQRSQLEKLIAKSETFQKWKDALSPQAQQAIMRVGLINWLSGMNEDQ
ncbi:TPA: hypothetical protein ACP41M_001071 [Klebsiella aerogenes]